MFLQICLITAGLHLGRSLLKSWRESLPLLPGDIPPRDDDTEQGAPPDAEGAPHGGEVAPGPASAAPHGEAEPSLLPAHPEEAQVQEQFEIGLLSVGLTTGALLFPPLRLLGGVSVMYGALPIFAKAKQDIIEERRIGIDVLDSAGIITSLALRQYGVSAVMFCLWAAAQKLRLKTEKASRQSMLDVFGRQPDEVWVLRDGVEVSIPFQSLGAGDVVVVGAGSPIPADGVVVDGTALVDQHVLTGESQPAEKGAGDRVLATTIVFSGRLNIRVETAGKETAAAEIGQILQHTADFASSIESDAKRLADATAPPIMAMSILAYPIVGARGAVALLNVGLADIIRVIAPLSMLNYLRKAYDMGILLKDGRSLQLLPKVDTVVFDKTGTLTQERLRVRRVHVAGDSGERDILACAAAVEYRQNHPMAQAIVREAEARRIHVPSIEEAHYDIGFGLTAKVHNKTVRVGSKRFMAFYALDVPEALDEAEREAHQRGSSLVYVARQDAVIGMIEIDPILRPEVPGIIRVLKERKLALYLLSGDREEPTQAMAGLLGLDGYYAEIMPKDKARIIDELQAQGKTVCFVGDGINDAIALKRATVSVSMSGASTAAMDSAQITIMEESLEKLPELFTVADDFQRNMSGIQTSVIIPAAVAVGGIFLAGFGTNAVAAAYLASMASGLAVAMWPHRKQARELAAAALIGDRAVD